MCESYDFAKVVVMNYTDSPLNQIDLNSHVQVAYSSMCTKLKLATCSAISTTSPLRILADSFTACMVLGSTHPPGIPSLFAWLLAGKILLRISATDCAVSPPLVPFWVDSDSP